MAIGHLHFLLGSRRDAESDSCAQRQQSADAQDFA
jgi:hypothetical protein